MPFVERDAVSVFYELEGDGPPLVLLVGAGGDRSAEPNRLGLVRVFWYVLVDLRLTHRVA